MHIRKYSAEVVAEESAAFFFGQNQELSRHSRSPKKESFSDFTGPKKGGVVNRDGRGSF